MKSSTLTVIIPILSLLVAASASAIIGSAFSQALSAGNITSNNPNATSMEANITGASNANNTNQSAPTAANMTGANASQSNASLSS